MNFENLPIPKQSITAIVSSHEAVKNKVETAFRLLTEARQIMKNALGDDSYPSLWQERISETAKKNIVQQFWRYIIRLTGVDEMMSSRWRAEVEKQLRDSDLPELTEANIHGWLETLAADVNGILTESVQSVFEFLRPRRSAYKTNTEFEVGQRCIISYAFNTSFGMVSLSHYKENDLRDLDNVFHLMDGKGVAKYPGNLITAIREALQKREWKAETPYFACKWFKAGTLHIRFKRMDLVAKLNRIAGGNRLKGAAANLT
jgi:hypothetical protein